MENNEQSSFFASKGCENDVHDICQPDIKPCLNLLLKVLFIYKKIEEGWIVRKKNDNSFEFFKEFNETELTNFTF